MAGNESMIYGYLQTLIGNPIGEAALLGNFDVETGGSFSPTSYNANEGAIGIAQWELGRRTDLDAYASAHGGSEADLAMQLGYLGKELTGPFGNVLNYLRTASDPAAAAAYVDANFERSSGSTRTERVNDAQTIYQQIQTGALTPSKTPTGTSGLDPNSLKAPLTKAQRAQILNWLAAHHVPGARSFFAHESDGALIEIYKQMYYADAHHGAPLSPISGFGFGLSFDWVKTLVIKGTFTMAGLGLAVLGMYAAAHRPEAAS